MKMLFVGSFNVVDFVDGLVIVMVVVGGVILFIVILGICGVCKKVWSCFCVVSILIIVGNK